MNMNMNIIPNLFIVGAPKAATTSIHSYISQHPDIFMTELKEPNYFSSIRKKGESTVNIRNDEEYIDLFSHSDSFKIRGESSTTYLYFKDVEKKIFTFNKHSKIIIILRDPVERALSHYLMDRDIIGQEEKSVEEALFDEGYTSANGFHGLSVNPYIWPSIYTKHIEKFINQFGKENVEIIIYEELMKNWQDGLKSIFVFLDVDDYKVENLEVKNQYRKFRYPLLKKLIPKKLISLILYNNKIEKYKFTDKEKKSLYNRFFQKDIESLEILLEKDLSIWKK